MVTTVITATIASASATAVAVVGLIILLVTRELADASERPILRLFSRHIAVYVPSLLIAFAFIVVMRVLQVIG